MLSLLATNTMFSFIGLMHAVAIITAILLGADYNVRPGKDSHPLRRIA